MVAKGKWKGAPGVFVAARKSQLGGLWPYLDNRDIKDRTAELRAQEGDREDDSFEANQGDGDLEDGGGWEKEWGGDEGWEPVVDLGDKEGIGGARGSRRRGGRGRRAAPPTRQTKLSREEREIEAMFGGGAR